MIDISRLCLDFRIDVDRSRRGWAHFRCPFCDDGSRHLGYHLEEGYFFCLRCGWHPEIPTIQRLARVDERQARELLIRYRIGTSPGDILFLPDKYEHPDELRWPPGAGSMQLHHREYLFKRRFDPDRLEREWSLMGTENWGPYAFRVIAPIHFRGQAVSWQGRDITDKQEAKYLPCPREHEILPHKHVLYGLDKAVWRTVVVVEGITGVWRLGQGAVATFGVGYTPSQLRLIAEGFDRVLILSDGDEPGQRSAERMGDELAVMGRDAEILEPVGCDSGDMPDRMAEEIMREVRG